VELFLFFFFLCWSRLGCGSFGLLFNLGCDLGDCLGFSFLFFFF
jgi:hypothetical protein